MFYHRLSRRRKLAYCTNISCKSRGPKPRTSVHCQMEAWYVPKCDIRYARLHRRSSRLVCRVKLEIPHRRILMGRGYRRERSTGLLQSFFR